MNKKTIRIEEPKQRANNLISAQIQPQYYIHTKYGWQPRNFKQMKGYLNLIAYGKQNKMGIYLYLVVHNESLKRKMNGIGMLRFALDGWVLRNMLQVRELMLPINKTHNQMATSVEKYRKFPKYYAILKIAKEKRKGKMPKGYAIINQELRADIKKVWGEIDEPKTSLG